MKKSETFVILKKSTSGAWIWDSSEDTHDDAARRVKALLKGPRTKVQVIRGTFLTIKSREEERTPDNILWI